MPLNKNTLTFLVCALLVFFNLFDGIVTVIFLKFYEARELNPIMDWAYRLSPVSFLVIKYGYTGLVTALIWDHRKLHTVLPTAIGVTSAYGILFIYQIHSILFFK